MGGWVVCETKNGGVVNALLCLLTQNNGAHMSSSPTLENGKSQQQPHQQRKLFKIFNSLRHKRAPVSPIPAGSQPQGQATHAIRKDPPPPLQTETATGPPKGILFAPAPVTPSALSTSNSYLSQDSRPRTRNSSVSSGSSETGADGDASTRPQVSPSSSTPAFHDTASSFTQSTSNLSQTNRTYKSIASAAPSHASTKPTTVMSGTSDQGANRIAQPTTLSTGTASSNTPTPVASTSRMPLSTLVRADSSNTTNSVLPSSSSIQFSALPSSTSTTGFASSQHYPTYSHHHPKNNPHPSSPALDNASVLTLASSSAGTREEHLEASLNAQDENASMRALPPSRRVSESSLNSRYSNMPSSVRPASLLTVATTNTGILMKERRQSAGMSLGEVKEPDEGSRTEAQQIKADAQHGDEDGMVTAPASPM